MKILVLILGVIFCSTSIIFIKKSDMESEFLASYRTLLAALILSPLCIYELKTKTDVKLKEYIKLSALPGFILALHFISWMYGARLAEPANSSLIVNLTPIVTPIFLYFMIKEKLNKREIQGTIIVMMGVVILAINDFKENAEYFLGDVICFFSMVFFALYLIYSRKNKTLKSLWLYVACLYTWCGLICFLAGIGIGKDPFLDLDSNNIIQTIYLAVITTILGHSLLNYAMKHIRGQIVSIINQFQFVFGAIWGVLIFEKIPSIYFYIACGFLFVGCFVALYKAKKTS
jgi:drug/metabolite transporter (DMT)-like permease